MKDRSDRAKIETAMAKYFASGAALRPSMNLIRAFGAYGYSTAFDAERLYRDAPPMAIGEGTNDIRPLLIGRKLTSSPPDGQEC